jgi:hypothetical protein
MTRILTLALAALLLPSLSLAATPAQLCESAKLGAASKFSACRMKADSVYAKSAQTSAYQAKRDSAYAKCDDALVKAYGIAEARYGASCPSAGDVDAVKTYLTQCSTDVGDATGSGANLTNCTSGTATAANVLAGKTFSSAAGLGATGTMPNNGAVTITPGATSQSILAGYHSGSGTVGPATSGNFLLKTGQTTSYGDGSDGAVQAGTAAKSFTDNGNGTVTDNRTGLVWAKKSDDGSIHDKDNTYTWGQTESPYSMNGTMVTTYLTTLNTPPCFAGACDWRMPNVTELLSLVNYETYFPATFFSAFWTSCTVGCTVTACSCTVNNRYWSSSTDPSFRAAAWGVSFGVGNDFTDSKTNGYYVRAVRGGS